MTQPGGAPPAPPAVHGRPAALALLVMLTVVWGVHWPVVKVGLGYFPPLTYASLRILTGLVAMAVLLGPQRRLRRPARADLPIILSVGLVQIAGSIIIQNVALQFVPAGRSSVLYYTMPLWVTILLWLFFRSRPRRNEILGVGLGVSGVLMLVNPTVIDWGVPSEVAGTLALAGYGVMWAGVTIHIRRHSWHASPLELHPVMLAAALVPVVAVALLLEPGRTVRWEPASVLILLYSGPIATAFAFWASQAITRSLGPIAAATGFLATPVIGLVSGALLLHESLGAVDLAGFGLVLAGIAAATLVPARPEATRAPSAAPEASTAT